MKRILFTALVFALFCPTFAPVAQGTGTHRSSLHRIWKKEQQNQKRIDSKLKEIEREAAREISRMRNSQGHPTSFGEGREIKP